MDGPFYVDSRPPYLSASYPSVTLSTTYKALMPKAAYPKLGPNYFGWVGKAVRLSIFGTLTTGATPGNIFTALFWGDGTDANGTQLNNNLGASGQTGYTNQHFAITLVVRCRAIGGSGVGTLIVTGYHFQDTWGFQTWPSGGNAIATTTVDLSLDNILNFQMNRSGSTAESAQVHDFIFEALN
jgi:hypothetical protein